MNELAHISLREARIEDRDALLSWRNDAGVRRYARDSREIDPATHTAWLAAVLADPQRHLLIGERDGRPVGVVRYDIDGTQAEISVYVVAGLTGRGLGTALIVQAGRWLAARAAQIRCIRAEVDPENTASVRAFEKAGFARRDAQSFEYLINE